MNEREQNNQKNDLPEIPSFFRVEIGKGEKPVKQIQKPANVELTPVQNEEMHKKKLLLLGLIILLAISALIFIFFKSKTGEKFSNIFERGDRKVINDELYIPKTDVITGIEGKMTGNQKNSSPIDPGSSSLTVVVPQAKLTVKEAYELSYSSALKWSTDAKLVFIKSLGTVTAEGRASEWQLVFGSASRQAGYEVIVWVDKVVSDRQVTSIYSGYELPKNWFDSSSAVESLRSSPEFSTSTLSAINFFYNEDAKGWVYGLQTSRGGTSMHLQ